MAKIRRRKHVKICGVDPGLAAGGAVILEKDSGKILGVQRLYSQMSKKQQAVTPGDAGFADTISRANSITAKLLGFVEEHQPDLIVVESFVDLGSQARRTNKEGRAFFAKDRWKTPLVIGYFCSTLHRKQTPLLFTNPRILRQYADEISLLTGKREEDVISANDRLLTNDHLIKAWCHADWASRHWEELRETLPLHS